MYSTPILSAIMYSITDGHTDRKPTDRRQYLWRQ